MTLWMALLLSSRKVIGQLLSQNGYKDHDYFRTIMTLKTITEKLYSPPCVPTHLRPAKPLWSKAKARKAINHDLMVICLKAIRLLWPPMTQNREPLISATITCFDESFFTVLFQLQLLIFHCVGGSWNWTQNCLRLWHWKSHCKWRAGENPVYIFGSHLCIPRNETVISKTEL